MPNAHNIYLASSWRNEYQPSVLASLRNDGHEVYDFRNPAPGNTGFNWKQIDSQWEDWNVDAFRNALWSTVAEEGFRADMEALVRADVVVLLLPSGRSAHTEAAFARGQGKPVVLYSPEPCQPELMYKMFHSVTATEVELLGVLSSCSVSDLLMLRLYERIPTPATDDLLRVFKSVMDGNS